MENAKNEYLNFMQNNYKNIVLKKPVFYNHEYALRFDLHKINRNFWESITDEYFIEGLNRANEIFYKIFHNCNELYFIYRTEKLKYSDSIFKNILGLNNSEINIFAETGIYYEEIKTSLAVIKLSIDRINYKNILESINNTDFGSRKPRVNGEIYFIHIQKAIVFHMYDDRGIDIVGINKKTIEPYYKKYNKWLLDYDRKRMDDIFK
jgi:hypothetical protein